MESYYVYYKHIYENKIWSDCDNLSVSNAKRIKPIWSDLTSSIAEKFKINFYYTGLIDFKILPNKILSDLVLLIHS